EPLLALSRLPAGGGRGGGVQREVHVQPAGAARRVVRNLRVPRPSYVPELLPARGALAVHRRAPGGRRVRGAMGIRFRRGSARAWPLLALATLGLLWLLAVIPLIRGINELGEKRPPGECLAARQRATLLPEALGGATLRDLDLRGWNLRDAHLY